MHSNHNNKDICLKSTNTLKYLNLYVLYKFFLMPLLTYFIMCRKMFVIFCVLFCFKLNAHPPIAIVQDSKGNIYYSDLNQVWKVTNDVKKVIVPHVHTHQLFMDKDDNLYGEHLEYAGEVVNKFYHYLWRVKPNGVLDTIISNRQAYIHNDYSLARDAYGNEYFMEINDTTHIYKRTPDGKELVLATGNFKDVDWLHVQKDGSVFYFSQNSIYMITAKGIIETFASDICSDTPSFIHCKSPAALGIWLDNSENVYVAAFSDRVVKKISLDGKISVVYSSPVNWTPSGGVFDNKNQLWVLEVSDKNEVRAIKVNSIPIKTKSDSSLKMMIFFSICCIVIIITMKYLQNRTKLV